MSILINKDSRIIFQGITGAEGSFHAKKCLEYGGNVYGGVTPGKDGQTVFNEKLPVFNTCEQAVKKLRANVSVIFVPPPFAAEAIIEAAESGIKVIVCITEGIPVKDMVYIYRYLQGKDIHLIGPNCPGLLTPDEAKAGIMPGFIAKKGNIGVVSRSGTLTYEAVDQLVSVGYGQSTCVGVGGDPIIGSSIKDIVALFEQDQETQGIVMIGEIGGDMEIEAAHYVKKYGTKPVIAFIAGQSAPKGRRMGHAGAIISGEDESADAKKSKLKELGVVVVDSPADIGLTLKKVMEK